MRVLDFADGFSSASTPTGGATSASAIGAFANDAAFVSDKGSAAAAGDIYLNTTLLKLRFFDGTDWNNSDGVISEGTFSFTNGAAGQEITGLSIDSDDYTSFVVDFEVLRTASGPTDELSGIGQVSCAFKPSAGWVGDFEHIIDAIGITFAIIDTAGVATIEIDATTQGGTPVLQRLKWKATGFKA
jgi:hypothetical protein